MSDLNKLESKVDDLTRIVVAHIAETNEYRTQKDKVLLAHSDSLWGKNGNIGLEKNVDRLLVSDGNRKKIIWAGGTATIGLMIKAAWDLMKGNTH